MVRVKLSRELGDRRMSIKEFAEAIGVAYNTAHKLYQGQANTIRLDILDKTCKLLGCQVGDILEYVPDEEGKGA